MIPIDRLPDMDWTDHARDEIERAGGDDLIAASDIAWQSGNLFIMGLIYGSYTRPPWLWFALAKGSKLRDLLDARRIRDFIPSGTLTAVAEDFPVALKFAEFYGFEKTGDWEIQNGRRYLIYRRV